MGCREKWQTKKPLFLETDLADEEDSHLAGAKRHRPQGKEAFLLHLLV